MSQCWFQMTLMCIARAQEVSIANLSILEAVLAIKSPKDDDAVNCL